MMPPSRRRDDFAKTPATRSECLYLHLLISQQFSLYLFSRLHAADDLMPLPRQQHARAGFKSHSLRAASAACMCFHLIRAGMLAYMPSLEISEAGSGYRRHIFHMPPGFSYVLPLYASPRRFIAMLAACFLLLLTAGRRLLFCIH